jgi:hypothetical protein
MEPVKMRSEWMSDALEIGDGVDGDQEKEQRNHQQGKQSFRGDAAK